MITRLDYKNHDEWLALRKGYIGGSDAASIVGLNPYSSPYTLWAEKTNRIPSFEGNLATEVGTYLEEFIAKKFEAVTGKKVRRLNKSLVNSRYPWAIANIDRDIVGEDAGLEIKSTSALNLKKFKKGEFPSNYYVQCVHYLAVTEKIRWYLAVLIGNQDFKIYQLTRIENDTVPEWCESSVYIEDAEISALMGAEEEFMHYVKTNTPPPLDGIKSTSSTLSTMYPESNEDIVNLYGYVKELTEYLALLKQLKKLEERKDEIANKIKTVLGAAGKGDCDPYKVSWLSTERETFNSKKFVKDHPEMDFTNYYSRTSYRTFKVTEKKEN